MDCGLDDRSGAGACGLVVFALACAVLSDHMKGGTTVIADLLK